MYDELSRSLAELERKLEELEDELPSIAPAKLIAESAPDVRPPLPPDGPAPNANRADPIIVWDERANGPDPLRPPFEPHPTVPPRPAVEPGSDPFDQPGNSHGASIGGAFSGPAHPGPPADPSPADPSPEDPSPADPTGEAKIASPGPAGGRAEELRQARGRLAEVADELLQNYDELLELSVRLEGARGELVEDYERLLAQRDPARPDTS